MINWKRYEIEIEIKNRIIGGVPTDPKLIAGWLKANMPDVKEAELEQLARTTLSEVTKTVETESKSMWTTFKRDSEGYVCIEGRQLKSAFKEVANILRESLQQTEQAEGKSATKSRYTAIRAKLAERLFVEEDKIRLIDCETKLGLKDPTGTEEEPIHVVTAQGPRTALKKFDFCSGVRITFHVRYLDDHVVDEDLLKTIMEYMQWNGIGAARSQGNGQFTVLKVNCISGASAEGGVMAVLERNMATARLGRSKKEKQEDKTP